MTIPAAVSSLTLTPSTNSAEALLAWTHAGTNLDHFQVQSQIPYSGFGTVWLNLATKPKADLLVSGTSYAFRTGATVGQTFRVVAFSSVANEGPSTTNPTVTFTGTVDGTWLLPRKNGLVVAAAVCWIGRGENESVEDHSYALTSVPTRREEISQVGELHLEKGTISGVLMTRNGQTASEWLTRLRSLIRNMDSYDSVIYATDVFRKNVEIYGPLAKSGRTMNAAAAWEVSVNYRELA